MYWITFENEAFLSTLTGMTLISIGFRFMCSRRMYRLWRLHLLESLSLEAKFLIG